MLKLLTRRWLIGAALLGATCALPAQVRPLMPPQQLKNLPRIVEPKPWQEETEVSRRSETFVKLIVFRDVAKEPGGFELIKLLTKTSDSEAGQLLEFAESAWSADGAHQRSMALDLCARSAGQSMEEVADALTKFNVKAKAYQEQLAESLAAKLGPRLAAKMEAYVVEATPAGKKVLRTRWKEWFTYNGKSPAEVLPRWCSRF